MDEALRSNRELSDAWPKIHVGSAFCDIALFCNGGRPNRLADYEREQVGTAEGRTLLSRAGENEPLPAELTLCPVPD